jgi:hypothetical protein
MQGVVDPETLYMKQNCIGMSGHYCQSERLEIKTLLIASIPDRWWQLWQGL